MSQIFQLSDDTWSELGAIMYERTGKLPEITCRIKWTNNETWEMKLPVNRTQVKVRKDTYVQHWEIPTGPDATIHVKMSGTNKYDNDSGILFQFRPKVKLLAKDLTLLVRHLQTGAFNITISRPQSQKTLEQGNFRPEDMLAVRCTF